MTQTKGHTQTGSQVNSWLPARLRMVIVGLLIAVGCAALVATTAVHWTERQLLNTTNWVAMTETLPQNPVVATALSNYAVTQLLSGVDLQHLISEALPPRADFLAAPLAGEVQTLAKQTTQRVIMSDQFETVWTAANRAASQRLIAVGRGQEEPQPAGHSVQVGKFHFQISLSSLKDVLTPKLGAVSPGIFNGAEQQVKALNIDLHATAQQIRHYIRLVDYAAAVLPLLTLVSLLGAVTLSLHRRRTLLAIGFTTTILALLQLIGLRGLRPAVLNSLHSVDYRPAAGVVYDTVVRSFNDLVIATLIGAIVLIIICLVAGPYRWAVQLRRWSRLDRLARSAAVAYWQRFRQMVTKSRWQIWGVGSLLVLVILAFWAPISWRSLTQALLIIVIWLELIELTAPKRASTS